jgi:hypothetical protein
VNRSRSIAALAAALCLAPAAWGGGDPQLAQAQERHRQERAHCNSGRSHQDRATCLQEAGAAWQDARRGALGAAPDGDLAKNAIRRCEAQPAADREACVQRISGAGNAQGSARSGGVIRRSETTVR